MCGTGTNTYKTDILVTTARMHINYSKQGKYMCMHTNITKRAFRYETDIRDEQGEPY